jgi:murein DD-endopeptidase MepM/ murein hydrolase activator NlpD
MRRGDVFAAFAHLAPGSVAVAPGQAVRNGDVLGRVGHTGNSTAPHLHFQLMDSPDPLHARGVPCVFRAYEIMRNGSWERVENGIPRKVDRVRYMGVDA